MASAPPAPQDETAGQGNNITKDGSKNTQYRMGKGERKLPRPVVFWSDNERDAFRRNKIVQTRYNMLVDDIENQRRASEKNIRYETHKFRVRSSKYKQASQRINENSSMAESDLTERVITGERDSDFNENESLSDSDQDSEKEEKERKQLKKGMITKIKKPNVKFSVFKEFIPNDDTCIDSVREDTEKAITKSISRSLSASQTRQVPDLPMYTKRSKSALPEMRQQDIEFDSERKAKTKGNYHMSSEKSLKAQESNKTNSRKSKVPNKIFFDKSVAAYELRKELQRLARLRKHGVVTTKFTMEDALKDQREKYVESRQKVSAYLEKLEQEKRNDIIINKWTISEVEHGLNL